LQTAAAALSVTTLSACASLPTSGPTVKQVVNEANANKAALPFTLKVLDAQTLASIPTITDPGVLRLAALNANAVTERADRIRPGDSLSISIFEIGVSLFGRGAMPATSAGAAPATSTAASQSFVFQVREDGSIDLPYIGTIHVSGDYPERVAAIIRGRLKSMSEHPEVTVSITETLRNAVYLEGAVQNPADTA
jgi:polysaccharide export outer membrane protein